MDDGSRRVVPLLRSSSRAPQGARQSGEGLFTAIEDRLRRRKVRGMMRLQPGQGRQRALLFEMGAVAQEFPVDDGGWVLELCVGERDFQRFLKRENLPADILERPTPASPSLAATHR